jgi:hypothetical protein
VANIGGGSGITHDLHEASSDASRAAYMAGVRGDLLTMLQKFTRHGVAGGVGLSKNTTPCLIECRSLSYACACRCSPVLS